jgi:translation initiation factor 4B
MGDRSKKNKKAKGKVVSLQDFLATSTSAGTTQVPVKIRSWADECEDDEPVRTQLIQLPTAPRASRILNDDTIPTVAPFIAFISNLPYEVNEDEIEEFFAEENIVIKTLSLPRDDNASGRLKGFGNIEFECREDLIDALSISNPTIRNRRIRINLPTEQDGKSGGGRNRNYDNYNKSSGDNDNTNWRERGREGDFDPNEPRENRRNYNRDYNKDRGNRDRNNRDRDGEEREEGGNWRTNRPNVPDSPPPERKQYGNRRGGGRFNDRRGGDRDRDEMPKERPKIILQPRTLPLPELHFPAEEELDSGRVKKSLDLNNDNKENHNGQEEKVEERPKPKPVPAESIFGQAKPVDTAAREREIEERLERERLRKLKEAEEERERQRKESEETKNNENYEEDDRPKPREEEEKLPAPVKKDEDFGSWRKQADNGPTNDEPRPRRIDNRDNRPKSSKDNRNRDYNRDRNDRERDYGRGGMNRDRNDRRRDDKDRDRDRDRPMVPKNRPPRMERERERERDPKDIEERMPKLKPSSGPNLSITNAFEGLKSEDEAD